MIIPEKIESWFSELAKTKSYYKKQIFEDETQFYEYLTETNLDSNIPEDYEYINKNRDLIFNSLFDLMVRKRDHFLIRVDNEFSLRNVLRIRIWFIIYFLVANTLLFFSTESALFNIIIYSAVEWIYVVLLDIIFYRLAYKLLKDKMLKYSYEVCDEDAQEYYQSYGKNVFGSNFLSEFDDSGKGYKIQMFKDKASDTINSMCVVQPILETDDQITIKIGFMGTSTDKKLQINIFNKMVDKVCLEQEKLKMEYPGIKVTVEIVSRFTEVDTFCFLKSFKDFKFARYETSDFKIFKNFNKVAFTKD